MSWRVLILGGSTEASALSRALAADMRFAPTLSLAGRTRSPVLPPVPCRVGGFGGVAGLAAWLRDNHTDLLVDATHPFAARISTHAVAAAAMAGVPLLAVRRPAWTPGPNDHWISLPDMAAAAHALGDTPRRVLLTVGQQELRPFAAAPWHHYTVRSVDPLPEGMLPGAVRITGRGPFAVADEIALLRRHGIERLVTKNSGGSASAAKLAAARDLGVAVLMVARPALPHAPAMAADTESALAWLRRHDTLSSRRGV